MFVCSLVILSSVLFSGMSVFAQLDNKENPLTAEKHSWWAEEVAIIGLKDASATDGWQEDGLINVIKGAVNWALWILGLIALLVLLYGWFLMVTAAGNEDQYGKWRTILKHASIWLAVIGLAWFVVSIIFWLINQTATDVWAADSAS